MEALGGIRTRQYFCEQDNCEVVEYEINVEESLANYKKIYEKMIKEIDLSDKELSEFKSYVSISGTPTVLFIENGEEETTLNRITGETSRKETIEKFKINGYIK